MQELDTAEEGGEELVDNPRLEAVPEVPGKLVVDGDAVSVGVEGGLLYRPQILHTDNPN